MNEEKEPDNHAVDGMVREYARTGGPEDDETFIRRLKRKLAALTGQAERDLPWLFGTAFWKVAALLMFLMAVGLGGRTALVQTSQPDPTEVYVFTQPRIAPGQAATVRVLVRDGRAVDKPVARARVQLMMAGRRVAQGQTDEDGQLSLTAAMAEDLAEGEHELRVEVKAATGKAHATQPVTVRRTYKTMLSTDKPLYQPGQTIHMRALSLESDTLAPVTDRDIAFEVRDAKGNKVFRKAASTSAFGIAAADFQLAQQVNEGDYTIHVTVGDTESERTVKVERYTLPKYKIRLAADRAYYAPGETVQLTLQADYTFGQPAGGASVTLRAEEFVERFRPFHRASGKTNAAGKLELAVPLKNAFVGQPLNQGDAIVRFHAEVTDATGETRAQTLEVKVTNEPLRLEVFPESGELVQGVENTLYIVAGYPDGTPASVVVYTGGGSRVQTNQLGIAKLKITPKKPNLQLTLSARDANGRETKVVKPLPVGQRTTGVLLRTDRAVYRQGETANLTVLSASRAQTAFLDVVKNGRSFATATIPLPDRRGTYALDLPPDLAGTVRLQAYVIQRTGEITRDTKVIQVHRANQLHIEAQLDAETYRPAEEAMIRFLVRDQQGDPVEAALSLAAVDEAVYALNDMRPGLEEMYFLIQEEILKPRYQLIARPPSHYTDLPPERDPFLEEANVVTFAVAEEGAGPATTTGDTLKQRQTDLDTLKRTQRQRLTSLLGVVPALLLGLLTLTFTTYAISRVRHTVTSEKDDPQAKAFRHQMRRLTGLFSICLVIPVVLVIWIARTNGPEWLAVFGCAALFVAGTVALGVQATEIRKLTHSRPLPLLRRVLPSVAGIYGLTGACLLGTAWAAHLNPRSIPDSIFPAAVMIPAGLLLLTNGLIAFLGRSLSLPRSRSRQGMDLALTTGLALLPAVLFGSIGITDQAAIMEKGLGRIDEEMMMMEDTGMPMAVAAPRRMMVKTAMMKEGAPGPALAEPPRVRNFFPETLLWQPQLMTNAQGEATLPLALADSITTWRLAGSAVSRSGQLGSFERGIRVFQDFFIDIDFPTALTQNDEITVPIAIFNYLDEPQTIHLEAAASSWFEFVDDRARKSIEVEAGGVLQSSYRLRALQPGLHSLTVSARGTSLADAVERTVRVIPYGTRVERVINGRLTGNVSETLSFPGYAVPGGNDLFLKIYPGAFSQVVEGMDSIFRMPHGCFEQTSSTTYPNILVLDYLRQTDQAKPELEMKALQYINAGYQRLLSYEVDGGGFEWFGNPPAHNILSAYGLMEFVDMEKVYEIDHAVIERTREWLFTSLQPDGHWEPSGGGIAEGTINQFQRNELAPLRATAYIAWAIAEAGGDERLAPSFDYLAARADGVAEAYTLALVANAFIAAERRAEAVEILRQLDQLRIDDHWEGEGAALTHGRGDAFAIETTALVAQAMLRANHDVATAHKALEWLISKRDGAGTWMSTQATVQAMRALLLGAQSAGQLESDVTVKIRANDAAANPVEITRETADVFHLVSLTEMVQPGQNRLELELNRSASLAYQIVAVHYDPRPPTAPAQKPLLDEIETDYSTTELATNELLKVAVTLRYHRPGPAPMTLVDLGIPPGFEIEPASFQALVNQRVIRRFEPKGRQVTLYFDSIPGGGEPTRFEVALRARFPVKAQAPASVAYPYYEPDLRAVSQSVRLTVR